MSRIKKEHYSHKSHNHNCNHDCGHSDNKYCQHDDNCGCEHSSCGCQHDDNHEQCSCGHDHGSLQLPIVRLVSGLVIFVAAIILHYLFSSYSITIIPFVVAYILLGYDILISAAKGIIKGHMLDENFLMSAASIGAFIIGEYPEAVSVMLFYRIGEALQDSAVDKSRKSITELMDIRPDYANIDRDGHIITVSPETVHKGDIIVVKNGEKVPLDGIIRNGRTFMDTVALTGESTPKEVEIGSTVLSGFINTGAAVHIEVTKEYHESTVAEILEITEHARDRKARSEQFVTKFAKYYTPIVVSIAVLMMIIPSLITGNVQKWVFRALIFLVASCPCALVVSIPLGFFAGIGSASRNGVLVKGSSYLEALSKLKTAVFDKTGTLTKGVFEVIAINAQNDENRLIDYTAHAERYSNHPVAESILNYYGKDTDRDRISDYEEIPGMGISAKIDGIPVLCGSLRLMNDNKIFVPQHDPIVGTVIYTAIDGKYEGYILISDKEKKDSITTISNLNAMGITTIMLTGDTKESAMHVSEHLGISKTYSQLLPQDKVQRMEQIIKSSKGVTAFVGDGINDAPVLALSDIGIAMGGLGSDSAVEAADIVLMTDEPSKILKAISISKKTMRIVNENIVFAIGVKIVVMLLGALGITGMWPAIFADVGVSLIAVLNSLRALK